MADPSREAVDRNCVKQYTKAIVSTCGLNRTNARTVAHQIVNLTPVEDIKETLRSGGVEDVEQVFAMLIDVIQNTRLDDEGTKNEPAQDEMSLQVSGPPLNEEIVMLTKTTKKSSGNRSKGTKTPGREAPTVEAKVGGYIALHPAETLGMALGSLKRQPKPRTIKDKGIDEIIWGSALETAQKEMTTEMQLKQSMDEYYDGMCRIGKMLLACELQRRTQKLYDYRASKKQSREI